MGMMAIEELTKAMLKDFGEEIDDANKYCDMAKAAEELGWDRTAEGFYEMARDEYTHAAFLEDVMEKYHVPIPEEHHKKFHELEERMEETFQ